MVLTKRVELTTEAILKHVTEFDIIQAFWPAGKELKFDKGAIESPFRNDRTPSFLIGERDNHIIYKDLGAIDIKGDVWKFVEQMENCDFHTALRKIDKWFNLGYTTGNVIEGKPKEVTWQQPVQESRKPTLLQVTVRKFNNEELQYWNSYHQDISDLKRENIYAPAGIWRNRKKLDINQLTFCYFCEDIAKWKIYRPYAGKRAKDTPPNEWKWDNSIGSLQYTENKDRMVGPVGIMTKSRKDAMVLRKATGINAICNIQAEDPSALTDDVLYDIWCNVGYKVVCMDNDEKGKSMSHYLSDRGYHHVNVPDHYRSEGITDFADLAKSYGLEKVTEHMKKKWII